jgi:hypothetical protein
LRSVAFALLCTGCLPGDLRPEPGSIYVTAQPSEGTARGFATPDGWNVTFDRFVTAVGSVGLHGAPDAMGGGETCNEYSGAHYDWLFDFTVAQNEKVGLVYGLGLCSVDFEIRPPSDDGLLGPGTTELDRALMRIRATDDYAKDERVSLMVRGQAQRDGVTKTFEWIFRRRYDLEECATVSEDGFVSVIDIGGAEEHTLAVEVRGEELFRMGPDDEAPLQFDLFAHADADNDGAVTMDELSVVDAPELELGESPAVGVDSAASEPEEPPTLADLVYDKLLPRIARFAGGGACKAEEDGRWR